MLADKLRAASLSVKAAPKIVIPWVNYTSSNTNNVGFYDISGNLVAEYASGLALNIPAFFRYGKYVFCEQNTNAFNPTEMYAFDLEAKTFTTLSAPAALRGGYGSWSYLDATRLIKVAGPSQSYGIFDMTTQTFSTFSYTAASSTTVAGPHASSTFYDRSSTGISGFGNRVVWTSTNSSNTQSELHYATYTAPSTLSARVAISSGTGLNYSRNSAKTISSSLMAIVLFDTNLHTYSSAGTLTSRTIPSFTEDGLTFTPASIRSGSWLVTTNNRLYYVAVSGSTYAIGYVPDITAPTPTSSIVVYIPFMSSVGSGPVYMVQVNTAGYVAIMTSASAQTGSVNSQSTLRIFNGLTQISTTTVNHSATLWRRGGTISDSSWAHQSFSSEFTNVLLAGTATTE